MNIHRVGILTGGGDAPGLNAVIRAFVKRAVGQLRWQVIGIEDSFDGLLERPFRIREMTPQSCAGLLARGGTVLGTTNKGDPFDYKSRGDVSRQLVAAIAELGLEGLVVIGGDGTQKIGLRLMRDHGIPVVGVPKTIDNDLSATDYTFGFQSAVDVATEALDRLHTTAESHDRVLILEVMGRDAGHIALHAGIAGGADAIVIPEIPYDIDKLCAKIDARRARNRFFTLMIVAEGATPIAGQRRSRVAQHEKGTVRVGGPGPQIAEALAARRDVDVRVTVLGHLQRGGSPIPFDRVLSTRFGVAAVDLVQEGRWGEIAVLKNGSVVGVPIEEATETYRLVDPDGELVRTAKAVGVVFGD
ncbi:MAG: ATP-dependent 6-phosphofructokinase [Proteobacteria bacterium]|nr:ATP-dependent 6-phosphofructokinase [Pseudomonadota bacterium]MCP4918773.1 ATP-dependent 6-phosphofructokinase [Pseudomonadota bacterium]